jgi:hypothetical protein
MATHDIHGDDIHFKEGTGGAHDFLKHSENKHAAREYIELAKQEGKAHFYADGKRFTIKAEDNGEGGHNLSVHPYY